MKTNQEILKKNLPDISVYLILGLLLSFLKNFNASCYEKLIDSFADPQSDGSVLILYSAVLAALCILGYIENKPEQRLFHNVYYDYKLKALEKVSLLSYESYCRISTGALIQKIENGAEAGKKILCDFYLCMIRELLPSVLFSIYFIWKIDPRITYLILGSYLLVFLVTNYLLKALYRIKEKILVSEEEVNHFLVRGLMEMPLFRLYNYFGSERKKALTARKQVVKGKVRMTMIHEAFFTIFAFFVVVIKISLLVYGWNTKSIGIGSIVALLALIDNAYTPVAIFNVLFVQYKLDKLSFDRYEEFLSQEEDPRLKTGKRLEQLSFPIQIRSLTFTLNDRTLLDHLSLTIRKGEKIALVGESGSGKSTLLKILAGLYRCGKDQVYLGREDLSAIALSSYFCRLSFVSQDSSIFDGTVRENILLDFGKESCMQKAKEDLALQSLFSRFQNGADTALGEKGIRLSGGERQKISLARLWNKDSDLILLDEPTSAMDNLTEEHILKTILEHFREKTMIAVMHRFNHLHQFQRILVFQDGRLLGDGTFEELMAENLYFRDLYNSRTKVEKKSEMKLL